MKYCVRCVMPDTRPGNVIDEEGVCGACRHYKKRKEVDYDKRWKELEQLCGRHKRSDGYYDCIIAVSSGKDSHYQTHVMKNLLGMNPLLVSVDNLFDWTETGRRNFKNLGESFGCDILTMTLSSKIGRSMVRIGLEEWGRAAYPMDLAIYVYPLRAAINYGIPLIVYGENISYEYGGVQEDIGETYSAKDQIYNTVTYPLDLNFWKKHGIDRKDLNQLIYPTIEEMEKAVLDPVYLSYFVPWNSHRNFLVAQRYGFKELSHEWKRAGHIDDYTQIDTVGYLMDAWLKYPKFGHQQAMDIAARMVRYGLLTRDKAVDIVNKEDHRLDDRTLDDFLAFTRYTNEEFWSILERFWNRDIFEKVEGIWRIKEECKLKKLSEMN